VQFNALTPCSIGANMACSRPAHFRAFQKLFCRFYVDDVDVLRISVLPSVLGAVRTRLPYSLQCTTVRHVCSIVRHLLEHSTLLYWKIPSRSLGHYVRRYGGIHYRRIALSLRTWLRPTQIRGSPPFHTQLSAHPHQWDAEGSHSTRQHAWRALSSTRTVRLGT
jgi:hypothetical protein